MTVSITDRDSQYMREMWGTTRLITDYPNDKRVLQEVMYDPANKNKENKIELTETTDENEFEYGIEPTYKLNRDQKLL